MASPIEESPREYNNNTALYKATPTTGTRTTKDGTYTALGAGGGAERAACGCCRQEAVVVLAGLLMLAALVGGFFLGTYIERRSITGQNLTNYIGEICRRQDKTLDIQQPVVTDIELWFGHQDYIANIANQDVTSYLKIYQNKTVYSSGRHDIQQIIQLEDHFNQYPFTKVDKETHTIHISLPDPAKPNLVALYDNHGNFMKLEMPGCRESAIDKMKSCFHDDLQPYVAYSTEGTAKGEVVYVEYGTEEDIVEAVNTTMTLAGKIALIGINDDPLASIKNLAYANISGILMFDKATKICDQKVPHVNLLPGRNVLSALLPSAAVPAVPVQTISCSLARRLMTVPASRTPVADPNNVASSNGHGTGSWIVELRTHNRLTVVNVTSIIATVKGRLYPDQHILVGASRNQLEPEGTGSSTNILMALTGDALRTLTDQTGWTPKRTIKFASWGGHEWGNVGLQEFLKNNGESYKKKLVGYFNLDHPVVVDDELTITTDQLLSDAVRILADGEVEHREVSLAEQSDVWRLVADTGAAVFQAQFVRGDQYDDDIPESLSMEDLQYNLRKVAQTYARFLVSMADTRVLQLNASRPIDDAMSHSQKWIVQHNNTHSNALRSLQSRLQTIHPIQQQLNFYYENLLDITDDVTVSRYNQRILEVKYFCRHFIQILTNNRVISPEEIVDMLSELHAMLSIE